MDKMNDKSQEGSFDEKEIGIFGENKESESGKCLLCEKLKQDELFFINETGEEICGECVETKNKYSFTYTLDGNLTGIKTREEARRLLRRDDAVQKNSYSIYTFDLTKEAKCILCNVVKSKEEIEHKICDTCKKEKLDEGITKIINGKEKVIAYISTMKEKELLDKKIIMKVEPNKVKLINQLDKVLEHLNKMTNRDYLLVSRSGKWSTEATKKEIDELIKDNMAEQMGGKIIRMTINIEQFKTLIIKRDKRKCHYCGKKAHGVFSESNVKTYSNSVCACIECEYQLEPKKLLRWLNIVEKKKITLDVFRKKQDKETMWLYTDTEKEKYSIEKETVMKLVDEGMAELIDQEKAKLTYNAQSFREFIVERENKKCHYCGGKGKTVDHVIPKSKGGITTPVNCVCACERCNTKKGNSDKKTFLTYLNQTKKLESNL